MVVFHKLSEFINIFMLVFAQLSSIGELNILESQVFYNGMLLYLQVTLKSIFTNK
jgi:hypothetical protein